MLTKATLKSYSVTTSGDGFVEVYRTFLLDRFYTIEDAEDIVGEKGLAIQLPDDWENPVFDSCDPTMTGLNPAVSHHWMVKETRIFDGATTELSGGEEPCWVVKQTVREVRRGTGFDDPETTMSWTSALAKFWSKEKRRESRLNREKESQRLLENERIADENLAAELRKQRARRAFLTQALPVLPAEPKKKPINRLTIRKVNLD